MTHAKIPDFTETETWIVRQTLKERYGRDIPLEFGDSEIRMHPEDRVLTPVPVLYWADGPAHFVIFKAGEERFRAQFYYRGFQQYGTGTDEYNDIAPCVITLLQVQSDRERNEALNPPDPGPTVKDTGTGSDDDSMPYYWGD